MNDEYGNDSDGYEDCGYDDYGEDYEDSGENDYTEEDLVLQRKTTSQLNQEKNFKYELLDSVTLKSNLTSKVKEVENQMSDFNLDTGKMFLLSLNIFVNYFVENINIQVNSGMLFEKMSLILKDLLLTLMIT